MRRLFLATAVVAAVAGLSAPALARPLPPVPVGVGYNGDQVCVYGFTWVPQCVPTQAAH